MAGMPALARDGGSAQKIIDRTECRRFTRPRSLRWRNGSGPDPIRNLQDCPQKDRMVDQERYPLTCGVTIYPPGLCRVVKEPGWISTGIQGMSAQGSWRNRPT